MLPTVQFSIFYILIFHQKDVNMQNYNCVCILYECGTWSLILKGRASIEDVLEQDTENIWTQDELTGDWRKSFNN
jgi:hypothetical protein